MAGVGGHRVRFFVLLAMVVVLAAATTAGQAKENTEQEVTDTGTWTGWAKDKISEGLGFKHEEPASDRAGDVTKEAEGITDSANHKAAEMKKTGLEKAGEIRDAAKQKVEEATKIAGETVETVAGRAQEVKADETEEAVKDTGKKAAEHVKKQEEEGMRWAKGGYESAKSRAGETLEAAKDTISSTYENAKHKSKEIKDNVAAQVYDDEL